MAGVRVFALLLSLGSTAAAIAAPAAGAAFGEPKPMILSPVEPLNGKDAGGFGGVHKLEVFYPAVVLSTKPAPGQLPGDILTSSSFQYVRQFGVAVFSDAGTLGRVSLKFYIYAHYNYEFDCYLGVVPGGSAAAAASGFKVEARSSAPAGSVRLRDIKTDPVTGIGDPPTLVPGIVKLSWRVEPQALSGAVTFDVGQREKTKWSFHMCSVKRSA